MGGDWRVLKGALLTITKLFVICRVSVRDTGSTGASVDWTVLMAVPRIISWCSWQRRRVFSTWSTETGNSSTWTGLQGRKQGESNSTSSAPTDAVSSDQHFHVLCYIVSIIVSCWDGDWVLRQPPHQSGGSNIWRREGARYRGCDSTLIWCKHKHKVKPKLSKRQT